MPSHCAVIILFKNLSASTVVTSTLRVDISKVIIIQFWLTYDPLILLMTLWNKQQDAYKQHKPSNKVERNLDTFFAHKLQMKKYALIRQTLLTDIYQYYMWINLTSKKMINDPIVLAIDCTDWSLWSNCSVIINNNLGTKQCLRNTWQTQNNSNQIPEFDPGWGSNPWSLSYKADVLTILPWSAAS